MSEADCSLIYEQAPLERAAMRFSWTGLMLAPLVVPTIFCAVFSSLQDSNMALGFLILMVPSCFISYCTTIFLFLPSLYLLSFWQPMTGLKVCLLGLVLGFLLFVPMTWMDWISSGSDSGPPTESFPTFFLRWAVDPFNAIYPLAGLITSATYWRLVTRRDHRPSLL
jgi:hypothetical protein